MRAYDHEENFYPDENEGRDEEEVINDFLGENPRARELRLMRAALEQRRDSFRRERAFAKDDRERTNLDHKIAEMNRQISVLREEEAITTFVEDSVRVTLHKPSLEDLEES